MRRVRGQIAAICMLLLLQHGVALVARTLAAGRDQPARASGHSMDCCRDGSANHICPVKPRSSDSRCRLRAGTTLGDLAIVATTWIGIVGDRFGLADPLTHSPLHFHAPFAVIPWISPPITPPPRA